jgi:hypothetical protein
MGRTKVALPWSAAYLAGSVRRAVREWTPPSSSEGISMRMASNVSLIDRRLLSLGFPSKGGKASRASLKRSVIASGVMLA